MADALKHMFDEAFFGRLADELGKAWKPFPKADFLAQMRAGLDARELNDRMHHCAHVLGELLPAYRKAVDVLKAVIPAMPRSYTNLLFPDFVAQHGLGDPDFSLEALRYFTAFGSSEFAVRFFLKHDLDTALRTMHAWAGDENVHVRRLASEGSRPRLPWSFKLDAVVAEPRLTQGILARLREDPEPYVRKSVANHLNDQTKDHPAYVLDLLRSWGLGHPHTAWIAKHACRNLIKGGHAGALDLFAFEAEVAVELHDFQLLTPSLRLGERLRFAFTLHSTKPDTQKLVVDYAVHYVKASGERSRKVFKLRDVQLEGNGRMAFGKQQTIQDFTTRKHHAGRHAVEVMVNGQTLHIAEFDLSIP